MKLVMSVNAFFLARANLFWLTHLEPAFAARGACVGGISRSRWSPVFISLRSRRRKICAVRRACLMRDSRVAKFFSLLLR
jgi:hypothetical protein